MTFFKLEMPLKAAGNLDRFFCCARSAGNIYVDIYEKQYASAIVEVSVIFDTLFREIKIQNLLSQIDNEINTQKASLKSASESEKDVINAKLGYFEKEKINLSRFPEVSSLIMKYGGMASSVALAKSSNEVQKAIEAFALPAGSSGVKRKSLFNVSLNGYVGVFAGHEIIKGANNEFMNNYGVSAPVGIYAGWGGIRCNSKSGGNALGFFISVIDIGALASFRFGDDSTSTVPTIQLEDIIAPGLFISWGIAGTPFSLSAGAQIGPLLRNVAPSINTFSDNYYWRYGLTFTVDIPILNLYNRSK